MYADSLMHLFQAILSFDSVSRANSRRTMPETRQLLREVGAVEFTNHGITGDG